MISAVFSFIKKPVPKNGLSCNQVVLFLGRSANGAGGRAGTALDASFGIDLVLAVSFSNRSNGALSGTGAAADAFIRNFVSHVIPSIIYVRTERMIHLIIYHRSIGFARVAEKNNRINSLHP